MLAFALVVGCEALWGYLTPGDWFANGHPLVFPSYLAAMFIGLVFRYRIRSSIFRLGTIASLLASVWYCCYVPDGWWVNPIIPERKLEQRPDPG
jgi:hypothetical protein